MGKLKKALELFGVFFKIGAFTFGGGYAMIPFIQKETAEKRDWITEEEILEIFAIAESTPGPIALNVATYIGYKLAGFAGAVIATMGVCVPSFGVMYLVSLFYEQFMSIRIISAAFKGIQICMVYLIAAAAVRMLKKMKKTPFNKTVYVIACAGMILCTLFDIQISSVVFIFAAGLAGLAVFFVKTVKEKRQENDLSAAVF